MYHFPFKISFFLIALVATACSATNQTTYSADSPDIEAAEVYINDEFRGTTPGTIKIYRARKEYTVSLRQGRKTVRAFNIEDTYNKATVDFVREAIGSNPKRDLYLTVRDLPTRDRMNFVIPFFEKPLTVEDNQYGLTIVVSD